MGNTTVKFNRAPGSTGNLVFNLALSGTATYLTNYNISFGSGLSGVWGSTSAQVTLNTGINTANLVINTIVDGVLTDDKTLILELTSTTPTTSIDTDSRLSIVIKNKDVIRLTKWTSDISLPGILTAGVYQDIPISVAGNLTSYSLSNYGVVQGGLGPWGSYTTRNSIPGIGGGSGIQPTLTTYVNPLANLDPSLPTLIKCAIISPLNSPQFVNQPASVLRIGNYSLIYQAYSDLTWDLYFAPLNPDGTASQAVSLLINEGNQKLTDIIIELLPGLTLKRIYKYKDGTIQTTLPDEDSFPAIWRNRPFTPTNYNINFNLNGGTGLAGFSITQGRVFTNDLLPITPSNL